VLPRNVRRTVLQLAACAAATAMPGVRSQYPTPAMNASSHVNERLPPSVSHRLVRTATLNLDFNRSATQFDLGAMPAVREPW
jgi:hypothetical protein